MPLCFEHEIRHGWPEKIVLGVDEAGRGPWAGPVIAACVYLPPDDALADRATELVGELNDSKKLSEKKREELFARLQSVPYGIGAASVEEIDRLNILQASLLAMQRAVADIFSSLPQSLPQSPVHILIDGTHIPDWHYPSTALIGGDGRAPSIAAASIIAKVTRDRLMRKLDAKHPDYGWARNKGYGVKAQARALAEFGVTPHHRQSFAPIRKILSHKKA